MELDNVSSGIVEDEEDIASREQVVELEQAEQAGQSSAEVSDGLGAVTEVGNEEVSLGSGDDVDVELAQRRIEESLSELQKYFEVGKASVEPMPNVSNNGGSSSEYLGTEEKLRALEEQVTQFKALLAQEQMQKRQAQHVDHVFRELQNFMNNSVEVARKKHSDYDKAAEYYLNTRKEHFKALSGAYPDSHTDQGALHYVQDELGRMIANCAKNKQNPAEQIYLMAKRLGYVSNDVKEVKDNVKRVNFVQKATKTLASSAGSSVMDEEGIPTDEDEFDAWINSDPKNRQRYYRQLGIVN